MTPLDVALAVARAFDANAIEYFLGGSMASSFQGQPRLTNDLDFVVRLSASQIPGLVAALGPDFDVDDQALAGAARSRGSWNIFHLPTVTRIDLFVVKDGEYDVEEFGRKRPYEVSPGHSLVLKTPEDSVLRKLLWFKAGGEVSSQQFRDVVEVLRVQGAALNVAYLDLWARKLGIEPLLQRARAHAYAAQ